MVGGIYLAAYGFMIIAVFLLMKSAFTNKQSDKNEDWVTRFSLRKREKGK